MTIEGTAIHYGDAIVIAAYFVIVLFVGLCTARQNRGSAGGYFLAGRIMHFIPVGASLFASNIGSIHFVGLAGSGATSGVAVGLYELNATFVVLLLGYPFLPVYTTTDIFTMPEVATFVVLLLGYLFLPVYTASGIFTMPEYMKKRFGGRRIQMYLAVLAILVYVFTKISADLYAGAIFIKQSLQLNIYIAIVILLSIAALFTIAGGLTAVIWTDFIQTVIMLIGAVVLAILAFGKVGGIGGMMAQYPDAIPNTTRHSNTTCGLPRKDYAHMFREPTDYEFPWPGIVGMTINSIWYWCADQVIVQRVLGARSITHGKAATIFCGYLKLTPLFLIVFPGMIARILYPDTVGCADPEVCTEVCGSPDGCGVIAYPTLVLNLMPAGARGLMLAVMLAALMSSLTSIFNSSSTIFAMDLWTHFRKKASEREIMIVGRLSVVVLVVVSVLWVAVIQTSEGADLFTYIQKVSSFLQPPMCAVFLTGLLWKRLNEKGAFWALMVGLGAGIIRFAIEYSYTSPPCGSPLPDPHPAITKNFPFLYFSMFLFALSVLTGVVVSLLTQPIPDQCLYRLTFWSRHSTEKRIDIDTYLAGLANSNDDPNPDDSHLALSELTENRGYDLTGDLNGKTDRLTLKTNEINDIVVSPLPQVETTETAANSELCPEYSRDNSRAKFGKKSGSYDIGAMGDASSTLHSDTGCAENDVEKQGDVQIGETPEEGPNRPWYTCCISWVCGLNEGSTQPISVASKPDMISIKENRLWRNVGFVASGILAIISLSLHAYFG